MKSVLSIRHVHFEDLGLFESVLTKARHAIRYIDVDLLARLDLRKSMHLQVTAAISPA
jgi:hypothetical protein